GIGGEDPQPNTAFGVAIADIDNDGDGDIAFHAAYENTYIYKNNNGTFQLHQTITYSNSYDQWQYGLNFADIDGDGDKDLITTPFWSYAKMFIYKNNGNGTFSVWQQISDGISAYNKAVGDIDGDNDVDIVIPTTSGGNPLRVYKNNGNGVFSFYNSFAGEGGRTVALGDIDNDNDIDAVVATMYYGSGVRIYRNNGSGNFTMDNQVIALDNEDYHSVALADINNDNKLDIIAGTGSYDINIFKNLGNGYFTHVRTLTWEVGWQSYMMQVRVADMNSDGKLDIISSAYSGGVAVWLASNVNTFEYQACFRSTLADYGHGMDIGYIDNNNTIDIVGSCANEYLGYVFLNQGTTTGTPPKAMNDSPECEGGTVHLYGLPANATYEWSGPNDFTSHQQNPVINNVSVANDGLYTLIAGNSYCYGIATTYVTIYDAPNVFIGNDTAVIAGTTVQFNPIISGGSGNYSYQWQPSGLLNNANISNPISIPLYQSTLFVLNVTDNTYGCSSSDTILVTVTGSNLTVTIHTHGNYVCEGQSVQLMALPSGGSGNYIYLWNSNPPGISDTSQTIIVYPQQSTTYYVTVYDGISTAFDSITINVIPLPIINAWTNGPYCPYDTVQLFVNSAYSYQWYGNNFSSTQQNPIVGLLPAGTYYYYVTIYNAYGCSKSSYVTVVVNPQPQALGVIQPDSLDLSLSSQAEFYGINTGGITSYQWIIENHIINSQNTQYIFSQTGQYPIFLIVSNNYNCYDTTSFLYTVYNSVSIKINNSDCHVFVAPNPTNDYVFITSNKIVKSLEIIDIDGKIVDRKNFKENQIKYNLKDFDSGVYFIKICTNDGFSITRLIKKY
ncbi:MAG: T9SS type A sorting domain-containing protein, partial [Bacteroidales bacterium]|nr:T9SS type A sorting domain-containing protein [Bacteroidales bacterium]